MTTHYLVLALPDDDHEASVLLNQRRVDGWAIGHLVQPTVGQPARVILEHTPQPGDGT
jgi:NOL1/NOP2/fmu family ribosome biogenesis protein